MKMKCLFLSAKRYSINNSVIKGFSENNWDVNVVDYQDFFRPSVNKFVSKFNPLPNKIKRIWTSTYHSKINKGYVDIFREYSPDIVFIYNNQQIKPEILKLFKEKAKIVFILGDNPLFTITNVYNLHILFYADYIICPDTLWKEQLKTMGIGNIHFDCFSFDPEIYHVFSPSEEQQRLYGSDFVYVGSAHKSNWGYKRFLFLNHFSKYNLKSYMNGDGYTKRWHQFFPELKAKIIPHEIYDPNFNNVVYNCSKIAPMEMVPSLFNGVHVRVFDALGSGILPLCEYSKDLEMIFSGISVPFIKKYGEIHEVANHLLINDDIRKQTIDAMRSRIMENYQPSKVIRRMLDHLGY